VHGTPLSPADLVSHDCMVGWRHEQRVAWLLKQSDGSIAPHVVPVKQEVCDYEMMLAAVVAEHGLAQLPTWMVAEDIQRERLVTVLDGVSPAEMPISILWAQMPALPAKIRVVVDEIAGSTHRFAGFAPEV
jgi:DNA-binding transcriptional LysR family regulator